MLLLNKYNAYHKSDIGYHHYNYVETSIGYGSPQIPPHTLMSPFLF